jgi:hypothetical protein
LQIPNQTTTSLYNKQCVYPSVCTECRRALPLTSRFKPLSLSLRVIAFRRHVHPSPASPTVSTIAKTEAHAGAGDAGEGYQAPQGGPRFEEGKENSHKALDSTDERSIANRVSVCPRRSIVCSTLLTMSPPFLLVSRPLLDIRRLRHLRPRNGQLAAAEKADKEDENAGNAYAGVGAAEAHGNKPSRGAQIDAEVRLRFSVSLFLLSMR